jgi:hypothetical protein
MIKRHRAGGCEPVAVPPARHLSPSVGPFLSYQPCLGFEVIRLQRPIPNQW